MSWFTDHFPCSAIECRRCGAGPGDWCKDLRWAWKHPERRTNFPHRERLRDWAEQHRYDSEPAEIVRKPV